MEFMISFVCFLRILCLQVEGHYDALNPVKVDLSVWHQRNPRVAVPNELTCDKPDFYICEEPPNPIPVYNSKSCNFRNIWYSEQVYRWVAGRGCLLYTPDFLYQGGANPINLNSRCVYGNQFAPCIEIAKDDGSCGCYPFDPNIEEVATIVSKSLVKSAQGRWEKCFYEAMDCCSHFMNGNHQANQCATTFDGWKCWEAANNGTVVSSECPEFAYSNSGPSCTHFSSKECHPNGTWELQTDYTTCSVTPRLLSRYKFYIAMLTISIVACSPAVFIFFFYKKLRVTRVALHRNLLIAIIIRNILVIISRSEIYIDELTSSGDSAMSRNSVACRVLALAERLAGNAVFVCMMLEGIHLHRRIVTVFRKQINASWLYGIGAGIACVSAVAWAGAMVSLNDHSCWAVYSAPRVRWWLDVPRLLLLAANTVLFLDVLRVLLTNLRNSENANQLNAAKATLFLIPIFGVQFIFTAVRPNTDSCTGEQIYYYVAYTVEGLQGLMVAILYCYLNREVHGLIKASYKKTETAVTSRIKSNKRRSSLEAGDRRHTSSTGLHLNRDEISQYSMKPNLHVAEIISIQASERLAEILDPVYETIENARTNEGYDCLERSDWDNDSGFIPHRNSKVDYYGFTNASSVSIGCQEWLKCVSSPASSIYSSMACVRDGEGKPIYETINKKINNYENVSDKQTDTTPGAGVIDEDIEYGNCNILDEIMHYIETSNTDVKINPNLLLDTTTLPADSTTLPADSTTLPSDTTTLPLETSTLPSDTTTLPSDTTTLPSDTTTLPADTTTLPADTTTLPADTTTLPADTTTLPANTFICK